MRLNKAFVFTLMTIIVTVSAAMFMYKKAVPVITTLCETSARSIALQVTNEAVTESIRDTKYDDLVELKEDANGKVVAINANVMELNRLSTGISSNISHKLQNLEQRYVKIPLTSIFNMSLLSGYGPRIPLSILPTGNVMAKFKSEFEQAGINQIRHRIFIEISTKVRLVAPFYTSSQEYINEITVAETVLVGDIPSTYYNITGSDINSNDAKLEVMQ
jgi:sporulation protein YunB